MPNPVGKWFSQGTIQAAKEGASIATGGILPAGKIRPFWEEALQWTEKSHPGAGKAGPIPFQKTGMTRFKSLGNRRSLGAVATVFAGVHGYQEGGVLGMQKNIAIELAIAGTFDALVTGASTAWKAGAATGGWGEGAASVFRATKISPFLKAQGLRLAGRAISVGVPLMVASAAFGETKASWMHHMKSLPLETSGSLEAFNTRNAATMRQRSVASIQKSHLNARSAFSQESQYMHIASYRGGPRR